MKALPPDVAERFNAIAQILLELLRRFAGFDRLRGRNQTSLISRTELLFIENFDSPVAKHMRVKLQIDIVPLSVDQGGGRADVDTYHRSIAIKAPGGDPPSRSGD